MPASSDNPSENQLSAHITGKSLLAPTIQAWTYYLEDQGNSPHTIKAFSADLRLLAGYLPADRTLEEIGAQDLSNFLDWMQSGRGVPCSPKTLSRRITSIKAFFRWLHERAVLLTDPAEKIPQRSVISPLPEVLSVEELQAFLEAANAHRRAAKPDARAYALAGLLLSTGIKKGECLGIGLEHVELETPNGPILFIRYPNPQNRYKERKIALTEDWIEAFQEYQSQYGLTDRLFPWSQRRLEYILEDLSLEAGVEKHVSFDMCRWTCALQDWRSDMERDKIRQKLGVSKIQWRELGMKLERLAKA